MFLVLQIPAFHVPGFLVPRSVPRSVPRFSVPCFTDSRLHSSQKLVRNEYFNQTTFTRLAEVYIPNIRGH